MVIVAVETVPVGSKTLATGGVRISTSKRHGFGASAPLSTRASFLQGRAGGSAIMPKLVELVGPLSTLFAKELSPYFARSAAASSVRLRVLVSDVASASMGRHGCQASSSRPAKRCFVSLVFSINLPHFFSYLVIKTVFH